MAQHDRRLQPVTIENARIVFRNFSGKEGQYNREGDRNFAVILPDDVAELMQRDGWNVKYLKPREDDEGPTPYIQVSVSYKSRPPKIVMISYRGNPPEKARVTLPEPDNEQDLLSMLDFADFAHVDLSLNPYQWNVRGETGVKAYLRQMFVTIQRDELEFKYDDIPEIDMSGNQLQIEMGPAGDWDENLADDEIEGEVIEDDRAIEA